jgi:peptidoglycan/LPS O-acetylase OafA/YrhL
VIYGWFVEYWVHFAPGACLFLALCKCQTNWLRHGFLAVVALLGAACAVRAWIHNGDALVDLRAMVEIAYLSAITIVLYLARPYSELISGSRWWRPAAALGTISYSLYLIHQFNMTLVTSVANKLLPIGTPKVAALVAAVALHIALATAFWSVCERPFLRKAATR